MGGKKMRKDRRVNLSLIFLSTYVSVYRLIGGHRSDVGIDGIPDDGEALHEFLNAAIEIPFGFEAGAGDAGVRDDVVAFVRVLANGSFEVNEFRQVLLDNGAEFE